VKNAVALLGAAVLFLGLARVCIAAEQQCGWCGYNVTTQENGWTAADSLFVSSEFRWRVVLEMRRQFERQMNASDGILYHYSSLGDCYSFGLGEFHLKRKYEVDGCRDLVLLAYEVDRGQNSFENTDIAVAYVRSRKEIFLLSKGFPGVVDRDLLMSITRRLPQPRARGGGKGGESLCMAELLCVIRGGFTPFWMLTSENDLALAYRVHALLRNIYMARPGLGAAPWFAGPAGLDCLKERVGELEVRPAENTDFLQFQKMMRPLLLSEPTSVEGQTAGASNRYLLMDLYSGTLFTVSVIMTADGTSMSDVVLDYVEGL
jgi:hypothetical protein